MDERRFYLYKHLPTIVAIAGLCIIIGGMSIELPMEVIGGLLVLASFVIVGGILLIGVSHGDYV